MDQIQRTLLEEVADLHGVPAGAYNIRANGQMAGRNTTANIDIITKEDKSGIDMESTPLIWTVSISRLLPSSIVTSVVGFKIRFPFPSPSP